jgi:histidinol-phosphatase (PHP family)
MANVLYDQHLHSWHSFDSEADPADNVRHALRLGLGGLTFTEHFDTHATEWPGCRFNYESYAADIEAVRHRFGDRIQIGLGIEICYQPRNEAFIVDYLRRHAFDLVILSVHWSEERVLYKREAWDGLDPVAGTRAYLQAVLEAAEWGRRLGQEHGPLFHVLGHLDMVRRYAHRFFGHYDDREGMDLIEAILQTCLQADLIPEVNTSTVRNGSGHTMPSARVVARYAELGGKAMALGSDAHRAEEVGADFAAATDMMRSNGIRQQVVFSAGRPRLEGL